jgi:acyl phosphate:glycerol-3-phosphate acyltransferase
MIFPFFLSLITAYLIGSLSLGIILSRIAKLPDPRKIGSQSAGATNVLRTVGKKWAIFVFIGDTLKGCLAMLLARHLGIEGQALGWIMMVTALGHVYPLFFSFKGGKGVTPLLGGLIIASPLLASISLSLWLLTARFTRTSSIAALVVAAFTPLFTYWITPPLLSPLFASAALLFWTHRDNLKRLSQGKEPITQIRKDHGNIL